MEKEFIITSDNTAHEVYRRAYDDSAVIMDRYSNLCFLIYDWDIKLIAKVKIK